MDDEFDEVDGFDGLAPKLWIAQNWRLYLHRPEDLEKRRLSDADDFNHAGIYFLWDVNGSLLYTGLSVNIAARMFQHSKKDEIPAWAFSSFRVDGWQRRKFYFVGIESAYIHALRPAFNVKYDARGFAALEPLKVAIQEAWADALEWKCPPLLRVMAARS